MGIGPALNSGRNYILIDYYIYGLAILATAALIGFVFMMVGKKKTEPEYDQDTMTHTKTDNPRMKKL